MAILDRITTSSKTTDSVASINSAHLVLDLSSARRPAVWQYDLSALPALAFEIEALPQHGYALKMAGAQVVPQIIAEFNTREDALKVLTDIQKTIQKTPLNTSGYIDEQSYSRFSFFRYFLTSTFSVIVGVILVAAGFIYYTMPQSAYVSEMITQTTTQDPNMIAPANGSMHSNIDPQMTRDEQTNPPASAPNAAGVPQNADDILGQ
jgi:hypothetical protein